MMPESRFDQTRIWRDAFSGGAFADDAASRDRFATAFRSARTKAAQLAAEIPRDLPEFTQHDVTHMDALWELADLISSERHKLNPAEVFVLGCAFLVHDLAMSNAVYKLRGTSVRDEARWLDRAAAKARGADRTILIRSKADVGEEIAVQTDHELIRELHAEQAATLARLSWPRLNDDSEYLIDDADLREAYGELIGRIASSHHWSLERVSQEVEGVVGAPAFCPTSWTVGALQLAALLRSADAAHLDASRTPSVLSAARTLPAFSLNHWRFQSKLQRPYVDRERLVFTSSSVFGPSEIEAWWFAYEALRVVDKELQSIDELFVERGMPRFEARGVLGAHSTVTMSSHVRTEDWEPVAAQIQVSDVAGLVKSLGGEALYGNDLDASLRELLMNAHDALSARDALTDPRLKKRTGLVLGVDVEERDGQMLLSVSDNGIGMSPRVMTGALLDFGRSSWLSAQVLADNPGLGTSEFSPSGRYGIGFFAAFMLGDRVVVTSRARNAGKDETWQLTIDSGASGRATLRRAPVSAQLDDYGTRVTIYLATNITIHPRGAFVRARTETTDRSIDRSAVGWLIQDLMPASEYDIEVGDSAGNYEQVISAGEWRTLGGEELLRRVVGLRPDGQEGARFGMDELPDLLQFCASYGSEVTDLFDEAGSLAGRVVLLGEDLLEKHVYGSRFGLVTAGPCRTESAVRAVGGILLGSPIRAARDHARPRIEAQQLKAWMQEVVSARSSVLKSRQEGLPELAHFLVEWDVSFAHIPVWLTADGWLTSEELLHWLSRRGEIVLISEYDAVVRVGRASHSVKLNQNIVVVRSGRYPRYDSDSKFDQEFNRGGMSFAFFELLGDAWHGSAAALADWYAGRERSLPIVIGSHSGEQVEGFGFTIRRDDVVALLTPPADS